MKNENNETQITFTGYQIEEILFKSMIKSKEILNVSHEIIIKPNYKEDVLIGIRATAKEVENPLKAPVKITFSLDQIEYILFNEMIKSKEITNTAHEVELDFCIIKEKDKIIISSINATAIPVQKTNKPKM